MTYYISLQKERLELIYSVRYCLTLFNIIIMKEIRVIFPDGSIVEHDSPRTTFLKTIHKIGVEKVFALGIESLKHPLITENRVMDTKNVKLNQEPVDGYWVSYGQNNKNKRNLLRKISSRLHLDLKVEPTD